MKKALWGVGIVVVGAGLYGLGWISHGRNSQAPAATSVVNTPPPTPAPHPALVSQSEWQQLRTVRDATMQANPDLAAEYKQIIKEMQNEQNELDAAMIKADPKVAPIIAKLVKLRERNGAHATTAVAGPR